MNPDTLFAFQFLGNGVPDALSTPNERPRVMELSFPVEHFSRSLILSQPRVPNPQLFVNLWLQLMCTIKAVSSTDTSLIQFHFSFTETGAVLNKATQCTEDSSFYVGRR